MRTMKSILSIFVVLVTGYIIFAQTDGKAPSGSGQTQGTPVKEHRGSVAGSVVDAMSGAALGKSVVILNKRQENTLQNSPSQGGNADSTYRMPTDEQGAFEILDVLPGEYTVSVERSGYLSRPMASGDMTVIQVKAGDKGTSLSLRLAPFGVVTGRILDDDGEPMAFVSCEILPSGRAWAQQSVGGLRGRTNDLGSCRIPGVPPGRYFLKASVMPLHIQSSVAAAESSVLDYPLTYFPGTTDLSAATALAVRPGTETTFDLRMHKVKTISISGTLLRSNDAPFPNASAVAFRVGSSDSGDLEAFGVRTDRRGGWVISGLTPGSYVLTTDLIDEGTRFGARLPIELGDRNVTGVKLYLQPNPDVAGHITAEQDIDPAIWKNVRVEMHPRRNLSSMRFPWSPVKEDGTFTLEAQSPDRSDVMISGLPENYFVKSVRLGPQECLDDGVELGWSPGSLEIRVSSRGAELVGTVTDHDHKPIAYSQVVLVPSEGQRQNKENYRRAVSDQEGKYRIVGIRPGFYDVIAYLPLDSSSPRNWIAISSDDHRGQRVALEENKSSTLDLEALIADSPEIDQ